MRSLTGRPRRSCCWRAHYRPGRRPMPIGGWPRRPPARVRAWSSISGVRRSRSHSKRARGWSRSTRPRPPRPRVCPRPVATRCVTAARRLIEEGAERALVTMGVEGAVLVTSAGAWSVGRAPEIGRFSVGSGDALIGGLVAAFARGEHLRTALQHGAAAAAANALTPGQGELDPGPMSRASCPWSR